MLDPSSQTISDKLHHAFAYFRQFVFVRTKRIETNAISAQKTHKKTRINWTKIEKNERKYTTHKDKTEQGGASLPHPSRAHIVHSNYAAALFPFLPQQQQLQSTPRYMPIAVTQPPTATTTSTLSLSLSNPPISALFIYVVCHLLCVPLPTRRGSLHSFQKYC